MVAERVVAVTGVSGFLGQRLLPLLDAHPGIDRVIGIDVRDPARRARKLDFHRVDILGTELTPFLRGVGTVVHLAAVRGPLLDEALFTRVNVDGTRRLLEAATTAGVHKMVRPSSATVYGAWANNPVPLTEDAPLRPSPRFQPAIVDAECERLLLEWAAGHPERIVTRLRIAPVLGTGADSLLAQIATGRFPIRIRGAAVPVQVVHADDAVAALELATVDDLDGAFNVAADGWLTADEANALMPNRRLPAIPAEIATRAIAATWSTGIGDAPPAIVPYLSHPWAIANDRLKAAGWKPKHGNDEAILLATSVVEPSLWPWVASAAAVTTGAALSTWLHTRRRKRLRG